MKGGLNMKQKHVDASREARLWLGQIILPAVVVAMAVPEFRQTVGNKVNDIKRSVKRKRRNDYYEKWSD